MTLYTRLPICAHSPEETHTTNAHTVMPSTSSINRNKPTVTVLRQGEQYLCGFSAESAHYGISARPQRRGAGLLSKSKGDNGSAKSDFCQVSRTNTHLHIKAGGSATKSPRSPCFPREHLSTSILNRCTVKPDE